MTNFTFKVLGANSATPYKGRFPSSFILEYNHKPILLDCGEGAQIKMGEFNVRRSKINHIFISHLHGDHVFGLPGFINSLNLNGREKKLYIYGPEGIESFIRNTQKVTCATSNFEIEYVELNQNTLIDIGIVEGLKVQAIPLRHRVLTYGYLFKESAREINIKSQAIHEFGLSIEEIKTVKEGESIFRNGLPIPSELLTLPAKKCRSFAYCTDTGYFEELADFIKEYDCVYHEATYTHELVEMAKARMHSTAHEAATLAKIARVGQLIIGHYSSRYPDLSILLNEARTVFPNTQIAEEGCVFDVSSPQSL